MNSFRTIFADAQGDPVCLDDMRHWRVDSRLGIRHQDARAAVLASLAAVDAVVIFDEDTPEELITQLKPDLLVKGADYRLDQVVGADIVKSYGGRIMLAPIVPGFSTTVTIARAVR